MFYGFGVNVVLMFLLRYFVFVFFMVEVYSFYYFGYFGCVSDGIGYDVMFWCCGNWMYEIVWVVNVFIFKRLGLFFC